MKKPTLQQKILQIFLENPGEPLSGESLAARLQVSRTAVWKAVGKLREQGYEIEGTPKLGYRLTQDPENSSGKERFNAAEITALLTDEAKNFFRVRTVAETGSTNSDVRDLGLTGESEGFVLIAESQTAGRGRMGRSFYSPKNSGLYLSILLRPELPAAEAVLLTAMAGVAASRAVESLLPEASLSGHPVMIKWVNDLFYHGRKICGILTEGVLSVESGGLEQAVLGLGFNLSKPDQGWPEELSGIAGEVFESGVPGSRIRLAASFLNKFLPLYRGLSEKTFLPEYRARMLVLGQTVEVILPDGSSRPAAAVDIDPECRLLVRFPGEDSLTPLGSGEVRIRI